jgi:hypothetical protein
VRSAQGDNSRNPRVSPGVDDGCLGVNTALAVADQVHFGDSEIGAYLLKLISQNCAIGPHRAFNAVGVAKIDKSGPVAGVIGAGIHIIHTEILGISPPRGGVLPLPWMKTKTGLFSS